ncbi:MAG: hypothetical protein LBV23_04290 [Deltaproteobacteria bacterium]|jgi:hypothetical protein|nr:hypothetical protein [Deltaproteobacteria bacterium]
MKTVFSNSSEAFYLQHEIDIKDSFDLFGPEITENKIDCEMIQFIKKTLDIGSETLALLLGINHNTMLRYELLSAPPFPQGNAARKLYVLIGWLNDPISANDIKTLMSKPNGLSTLSGLLQSESVSIYQRFSPLSNKEVDLVDRKPEEGEDGTLSQPKPKKAMLDDFDHLVVKRRRKVEH